MTSSGIINTHDYLLLLNHVHRLHNILPPIDRTLRTSVNTQLNLGLYTLCLLVIPVEPWAN